MKDKSAFRLVRHGSHAAYLLAGSIAALLASGITPQARAATWDVGTGTWDTGTPNWAGATTWVNGSDAEFGGTANSTITINEAGISAANLTFNIDGDTVARNLTHNLTLTNGNIAVGGGLSATISAPLAGINGVTKQGAGTLVLAGTNTYSGNTVIGGGTLSLGVANALAATSAIQVNGGGILNLGTNNQWLGNLSSATAGGSIIGSATLTLNPNDNQTFAGSIAGSINLIKLGDRTLTLSNANATTSTINVTGGGWGGEQGLTLRDNGTLAGAASIHLGYATLTLDNTGTTDLTGRPGAAPITLDSGRLVYYGRDSITSTETLGDVTARSGLSYIAANAGNSSSAALTLSSLTRSPGAMIRLDPGASLGQGGNNPGLFVTAALAGRLAPVNGVVPGLVMLVNGADNRSLVGYDAVLGFVPVATVSGSDTSLGTDNVTGAWALPPGGQAINSNTSVGGDFTFAAPTDTLTITSGMLYINDQTSAQIGSAAGNRGALTTGTGQQELFILKDAEGSGPSYGALLDCVIKDNGSPVQVVFAAVHPRTDFRWFTWLTAPNAYTGGTVVSGFLGIKLKASSAGIVTIPAAANPADGLVINNAAVVMEDFAGQIAPTNIVTLGGSATLTLYGDTTLAGLVYQGNGYQPAVINFNTGNTLTITGDIVSQPTNPTATPVMNRGDVPTLDLDGTDAHAITVDALPQGSEVNGGGELNGLTIDAAISNGGFTKKGAGVLNLTGNNTYAGNTTIEGGTLRVTYPNFADASTLTIGLTSGSPAVLHLPNTGIDTVAALVIDGVAKDPGIYGAANSGGAITGAGQIQVGGTPPAVTYASWAHDNGIDGEPAAGDFDNDGVDNAVEMVLGGDPAARMDAGLMPTLALVTNPPGVAAGEYLEFTCRRTDLSVTASVTAACQYNTDLGSIWTTVVEPYPEGVVVQVDNDYVPYGTATDRVRVYVPRGENATLFGRLQVTVP